MKKNNTYLAPSISTFDMGVESVICASTLTTSQNESIGTVTFDWNTGGLN